MSRDNIIKFYKLVAENPKLKKKMQKIEDKKLKNEVSVSELSLTQTDGETKTLKIKGMMCGHCEARVKQALESLEGVEEAKVSHEAGTAVVILSAPVDEKFMKQNVEKEGYKVLSIK